MVVKNTVPIPSKSAIRVDSVTIVIDSPIIDAIIVPNAAIARHLPFVHKHISFLPPAKILVMVNSTSDIIPIKIPIHNAFVIPGISVIKALYPTIIPKIIPINIDIKHAQFFLYIFFSPLKEPEFFVLFVYYINCFWFCVRYIFSL